MALGSTRPLTEMSTRNISWEINAAGAYSWQAYHLHVPIVLKSGSLDLLEPFGPVQACNGTALPLLLYALKFINDMRVCSHRGGKMRVPELLEIVTPEVWKFLV
jgi:hypothetical protein